MSCPCCKKPMQEYHLGYNYCSFCECIALHVEDHLPSKEELHHYSLHENSIENEGYVKMFQGFLDFISLHVKDYERVLEFGCGPGPVLAEILTRQGKHVTCYDKYFHEDESYKEHTYDLITSTEVFEHLDDPLSVLTTLASLLKPNGSIALMTHFHYNNKERFRSWWYPRDPTHITFFTPRTFEVLAAQCGLKVLAHDDKKQILLQKM